MYLEKRLIKKWTFITLFCGTHSFLWGIVIESSIIGMIAGLITLILTFSLIDSHPQFQARRTANPLFAQALDRGIKIRLWLAVLVIASGLAMLTKSRIGLNILIWPEMAELWIGMGATKICDWITGIDINNFSRRGFSSPHHGYTLFLATYIITIITALIHTVILALICGTSYVFLWLRKKP